MSVSLPYEFDTTRAFRTILKIMLGLLAVVVLPGIIYSAATGRRAAAVQLGICAALLAWFVYLFFRNASGSRGTITRSEVVVAPGALFGVTFPGPSGRFPIERFRSLRVERVSGPTSTDVQGGPHERIYLIGKPETPDVLVARTDHRDPVGGEALGNELAVLLGLPCVVTNVAR